MTAAEATAVAPSVGAPHRSRRPITAGALLLAALAVAAVLSVRATRGGLGVSPDSAAYIGAARNLLAGHGLSVAGELLEGGRPIADAQAVSPLVHFPPLYPLMLAAGGVVGPDPYGVARWVSVLSLLALAALLYAGVRRACDGRVWPAVLGTAMFVLSPVTTPLHLFANSEPPFLVLAALSLWLLAEHLVRPRTWMLVATAAFAALAVVTRYVGVAGVIAGAVALLVLSREPRGRRLRGALLFCVIALLPMCLWSLRNQLVAGTTTNRAPAWHPVTLSQLRDAADAASMWLLPERIQRRWRLLAMAAAIILSIAGAVATWRQRRIPRTDTADERPPLAPLVALFAVVYLLFVLTSVSLFDAATPLDDRILFPVFAASAFLVPVLLDRLTRRAARARGSARWASALLVVTVFLSLGGVAARGTGAWLKGRREGLDYASPRWRASELARAISALPPDRPVYTNAPDAALFLTGRNCHWVPRKWHTWSLKPNGAYAGDVAAMRAALEHRGGVIAQFHLVRHRNYLPSVEELAATMPLKRDVIVFDGAVYAWDAAAASTGRRAAISRSARWHPR